MANKITLGNIAEICHESIMVYQSLSGRSLGLSMAWRDVPLWLSMEMVINVVFVYENQEATSEDIHNNWLAFKKSEGWTPSVFEQPKSRFEHQPLVFSIDPLKKQHCNIMPFVQLSEADKIGYKMIKSITLGLRDQVATDLSGWDDQFYSNKDGLDG